MGFEPMFGSELEFFLFRESYLEAHAKHYHDLTPSVPYILDYHILASELRRAVPARGADGDEGRGDDRRVARRARRGRASTRSTSASPDALRAADDHVVYKTGAQGDRVPARLLGHVHGEAAPRVGRLFVPHPLVALAGRQERVRRRVGGLQALPRRPDRVPRRPRDLRRADVNSYKRFAAGQLGADDARLGLRQPHVRLPRRRARLRAARPRRASPAPTRTRTSRSRRCSPPGLYGIEQKLELAPALEGNAYISDARALPARAARGDRAARVERRSRAELLGDEVVDHYLNYARTEQELFDKTVTGYERERMFERGYGSPLIGITTYVERGRVGRTGSSRRRSSRTTTCAPSSAPAGGPCSCRRTTRAWRRCSTRSTGSIFSGGTDLDAGRRTARRRIRRRTARIRCATAASSRLLEAALARDLPVLAICRGVEVLNVARGGDLVQHLPGGHRHEEHRAVVGDFSEHAVRVDRRLAARRGRAAPSCRTTTRVSAESATGCARSRGPTTAPSRRSRIRQAVRRRRARGTPRRGRTSASSSSSSEARPRK